MVFFKLLLLLSSVVCVMAAAIERAAPPPMEAGCGELNIIATGLPPFHPIVTQLSFDPKVVEAAIRADAANITKLGYNLKVVLMGPEQDLDVLRTKIGGTQWQATGVGFGMRGAPREDTTIRFTGGLCKNCAPCKLLGIWLIFIVDLVNLYRSEVPNAPILFDYSPTTMSWALQRAFRLPADCQPGKDLEIERLTVAIGH
ncbi:hypothetical protein HYALB_00006687 [Hymenoscyphus albidus]|uniref:Uncharacterized protein n=1 Tax=Hymenoscyphus albidus TaxID=595503 RepID=A0A9N9LJ19_9HELO|nr:hypothetical protein HYALB_00006687 [Hymenoscyphus albidus]